jgi:hypothetical protein
MTGNQSGSINTTNEHVSFAAFITLCGIPQEAIDSIWESEMLAQWEIGSAVPHAPSQKIADMLFLRQTSLRTLGAAVQDAATLVRFADSKMPAMLEGLAHNVLLPDEAVAKLDKAVPGLVADRVAVLGSYDATATSFSEEDAAALTDRLVSARCGVAVEALLSGNCQVLAAATRSVLVEANGGSKGAPARAVRGALVATGNHDDLVLETLLSAKGVIDVLEVPAVVRLVNSNAVSRDAIQARAHHDAIGMVRRLGIFELAPVRARQAMTKEAEDVVAQFEVYRLIDPTSAARRAIHWWSSLEQGTLEAVLEAADIETVVDWAQGAMQVLPDAEEVVALMTKMPGSRFDEFCAEVTLRPDPTEEQPALSIAIREPMNQQWRPAGVHAAVQHLCAELTDAKTWHLAMALLANGWKSSTWELAACAKQM